MPVGNNSVEAYLEIEYEAGVTRAQIEALLVTLSKLVTQGQTTTTVEQKDVGWAEFMILEAHKARWHEEWELLKRRLLAEFRT